MQRYFKLQYYQTNSTPVFECGVGSKAIICACGVHNPVLTRLLLDDYYSDPSLFLIADKTSISIDVLFRQMFYEVGAILIRPYGSYHAYSPLGAIDGTALPER